MTDYNRRAVFAVACAGMLLFGIVLTTLGAILPDIMTRFNVSKATAGSLFLLMTFGILLGSLIFGPSVDRTGYRLPLAGATALAGLGVETIAFAPSLTIVRVGVLLIGLGGGVLNVATNGVAADIADGGKAAKLSLLGVFFGVGAVGVPFGLGALGGLVSQTAVLAAVGAIGFACMLATLAIRFPQPKQPQSLPIAQALKLVREKPLILLGLILFLQSGMEITVGGWTSTFAREELTLGGRAALFFLSLYWLGMMIARLLLGIVLVHLSPRRVFPLSLLLALVGVALLIASHATLPAAVGVFLVGAGFAAVFPIVLGWVGERYPAQTGTAFSIALVMALTGGMILPYVTGLLSERFGMRASLAIVPVALLLAGLLFALLSIRRFIVKNPQPEMSS
jgi:fucose permease